MIYAYCARLYIHMDTLAWEACEYSLRAEPCIAGWHLFKSVLLPHMHIHKSIYRLFVICVYVRACN